MASVRYSLKMASLLPIAHFLLSTAKDLTHKLKKKCCPSCTQKVPSLHIRQGSDRVRWSQDPRTDSEETTTSSTNLASENGTKPSMVWLQEQRNVSSRRSIKSISAWYIQSRDHWPGTSKHSGLSIHHQTQVYWIFHDGGDRPLRYRVQNLLAHSRLLLEVYWSGQATRPR